jgi:hypothetical protein
MRRLTQLAVLFLFFAATAHAETVQRVWHRGSQDLLHELRPVSGLSVIIAVNQPTQVFFSGHIDVKHRCIPAQGWGQDRRSSGWGADYPIAVGFKLEHLSPGDNWNSNLPDGAWVPGGKWGQNIASCEDHYSETGLDAFICLTKLGNHKFTIWGVSDTTATDYNGVAEINPASDSDTPQGTNDPYNQMIVRSVPTNSC